MTSIHNDMTMVHTSGKAAGPVRRRQNDVKEAPPFFKDSIRDEGVLAGPSIIQIFHDRQNT